MFRDGSSLSKFLGRLNGLKVNIYLSTYARNSIQVPKDAECVVSYLTLIHLISLSSLVFE